MLELCEKKKKFVVLSLKRFTHYWRIYVLKNPHFLKSQVGPLVDPIQNVL